MVTNIFLNLPTKNLNKSIEFFKSIGFKINSQFTDETAASVVISENIFVMILTEEKFKEFSKKEISDSAKTSQVITALSVDTKDGVDELFNKAIAAGAKESNPAQDYGFMISRSFEDLDGHLWEVIWMEPSYVKPY